VFQQPLAGLSGCAALRAVSCCRQMSLGCRCAGLTDTPLVERQPWQHAQRQRGRSCSLYFSTHVVAYLLMSLWYTPTLTPCCETDAQGPLMLEMGVLPDVAAATSATMILFTSAAAAVVFLSFGGVPPGYAGLAFAVGLLSTAAGQVPAADGVRSGLPAGSAAEGWRRGLAFAAGCFACCGPGGACLPNKARTGSTCHSAWRFHACACFTRWHAHI